jgi:hypothetical protein
MPAAYRTKETHAEVFGVERRKTGLAMGLGRVLIVLGLGLVGFGLLIQIVPALRLGRLPGDLSFGGAGWRVYLPLGTSLLLSIVLTLIFALVGYFARR